MDDREDTLKVLVNSKDRNEPRQEIEAELVKETETTVIVRLPDGNIISRKKNRDLPKEAGKDNDGTINNNT